MIVRYWTPDLEAWTVVDLTGIHLTLIRDAYTVFSQAREIPVGLMDTVIACHIGDIHRQPGQTPGSDQMDWLAKAWVRDGSEWNWSVKLAGNQSPPTNGPAVIVAPTYMYDKHHYDKATTGVMWLGPTGWEPFK